MHYKTICLSITDKCTAECEFCGLSCCPDNDNVMDPSFMERIIREAKKIGIKKIGFSGGEPFLFPDLLLQGTRIAKEEDLDVNIATNGFWGSWDDDRIVDYLKELSPKSISFSYDKFHQQFIPEDDFFHAVSHVYGRRIDCTIAVADMTGEDGAGRFLKSLGKKVLTKEYNLYPAYRVGRAKNLPEEMFFTFSDRTNIVCLYEGILSVMYNGDVYPCCRHQSFDSAIKLGNALDSDLAELIKKSDVAMICETLMNSERFNCLLETAESLGISVPKEVGCSCDFCRALFGTEENMKKMLPAVKDLYGRMLVRSLMKEANVE
ncbi:MAG: radical SAM protein [Lachnospiraceae bacterium]|nr:radical SAM protein [Lachnospiraceae bacterium]